MRRYERRLAELDFEIELLKAQLRDLRELRASLLEGFKPLFVEDVLNERDEQDD